MRLAPLLLALLVTAATAQATAQAQEKVQFASLDGRDGAAPTTIEGYLFRPPRATGPAPYMVFLHGCGGLISGVTHAIVSREMEWTGKLNAMGIGVLMVDSFGPRGSGEMCSRSGFKDWLYKRRPADAYGALVFLQSQPYVARDRIGVMGWSNGGGAVLFAVGTKSLGRPPGFTAPDFRAAIAFYPGSCSEDRMGADWATSIPLLILVGAFDVWTPAVPCRALSDSAAARGSPVDFHAYEGAYHDFDWPNLKRHELTAYTTSKGVVPITGEDPKAHADAIKRVQAFLANRLLQ